jgi:hypothetical protein
MLPNSRGSKASSSMGKRISRTQEYDSGAIAPTLANNARMGHPRFFRGDIKKNRNGGPPAHIRFLFAKPRNPSIIMMAIPAFVMTWLYEGCAQ